MTIGVYSITSPSKRVYIGSSKNIESRWKDYNKRLGKNQTKLNRSFIKYGVSNHIFKIEIECTFEELYEWEHHYSNYYDSIKKGLNCQIPGFKDIKGIVSQETRLKIGLASTNCSQETRQKISSAHKNKKFSDEHKLNISKSKIGNKNSVGRKLSEAHKEKIRQTHTGKVVSKSQKLKQSLLMKGRKFTDDHIKKLKNRSNPTYKWIVNIQSGVFYLGLSDACKSHNLNINTLRSYLSGRLKNKTSLYWA